MTEHKVAFLVLHKPPNAFGAKCSECGEVMYLSYDDVQGMVLLAEDTSKPIFPLCQDCFKKHLGEETYREALTQKEDSVYTAFREENGPFQCERCEASVFRDPIFGPSVEAFNMPVFCAPCVQEIRGVTSIVCECGCGRNILETAGTTVLNKPSGKEEMVQ